MESCIVAAGSPAPWGAPGAGRRALAGKPKRMPKIAPFVPRKPFDPNFLRIEAMHLASYHEALRIREANERRQRLPCLKCGKRYWTTRCNRICEPCQELNDLGR